MPALLRPVRAVWVVVHPRTSVLPHARIVRACDDLGVVPERWVRVESPQSRPGDLVVLLEPPPGDIPMKIGDAVLIQGRG